MSVGGTLAWVAWGAVAEAAGELLASGTQGYADLARLAGGPARAPPTAVALLFERRRVVGPVEATVAVFDDAGAGGDRRADRAGDR